MLVPPLSTYQDKRLTTNRVGGFALVTFRVLQFKAGSQIPAIGILHFVQPLIGVLSFLASRKSISYGSSTYAGVTYAGDFSYPDGLIKLVKVQIANANLSFGGLIARGVAKILVAAVLNLIGSTTNFVRKSFIASISFSGTVVRIIQKRLSAALMFIGFSSPGFGLITKGLNASLTLTGSIPIRAVVKRLTGFLSLAGSIRQVTGKRMQALLNFSGGQTYSPNPTAFAFYFVWWGKPPDTATYRHWDGGNSLRPDPNENIAATFYPQSGPYYTGNGTVLAQQMIWLKRAGIDVLLFDWWGQGSYEDQRVQAVLDAAAIQGLKVSFVVDSYSGITANSVISDIAYLQTTYGSHSALYKTVRVTKWGTSASLRPVIWLYAPPYNTQTVSDAIHGSLNDAILLMRSNDNDLLTAASAQAATDAGHLDGLFNFGYYNKFGSYGNPLPLQNPNYILAFCACPGFDNTRNGGSTSIGRQNGKSYDDSWWRLVNDKPEWVTVNSFNEWHEGTIIEPAQPFTYVNGPFTYSNFTGAFGLAEPDADTAYLDRTAALIASYKHIALTMRVQRILTGLISFVGSTQTQIQKSLVAMLSFVGLANRTFLKTLVSTLSLGGSVNKLRAILLSATMTPTGNLTNIRWYLGVFKQASIGTVRAVSRAVKFITMTR